MLEHEKQIRECEDALSRLKKQGVENGIFKKREMQSLEGKLEKMKEKVYRSLTPWQRVEISRHPDRPKASDYIKSMCDSFKEIFGDRLYKDDAAIITGFGTIQGQKVAFVTTEKGADTQSRLYRNFGMPHPEGYRKALRLMKLAEKFSIPVVTLIDTPGAFAGLAAEERGQGWAIAENLFSMARLKTPIISLIIGEGCSGGALGIGVADHLAMLRHAYYSVISPEGCASILWRDSSQKATAAEKLKMHAEYLHEQGIIDAIIEEPQGGAHFDPSHVFDSVREHIVTVLASLKNTEMEALLEERYQKYRNIGAFSEEGQ